MKLLQRPDREPEAEFVEPSWTSERWTWVMLNTGFAGIPIPVCEVCGCMVPEERIERHEKYEGDRP